MLIFLLMTTLLRMLIQWKCDGGNLGPQDLVEDILDVLLLVILFRIICRERKNHHCSCTDGVPLGLRGQVLEGI